MKNFIKNVTLHFESIIFEMPFLGEEGGGVGKIHKTMEKPRTNLG